ncbi:DNA alkylation repair protein [uncultured Rikenella sp.]|uniref:DNA alkylation repair protein n=1 Tax=uncultured Rikenella sp. TaxID=368003 RepID=UPI0026046065|nr:DNA alkylation repair protein [uncultured Rikenella sp.]
MPTTNDKMVALLRRLRIEMNGAVTDAMRAYGGQPSGYGLNYGVSLPTIREVAAASAPDSELAALLWRQDVRELKLAALFIDDPQTLDADRMEQWADAWRGSTELAEQSAMQLFWRSPAAWKVAVRWATATGDASDPLRRLAAFFMVGRLAAPADGSGAVTDADFAALLAAPTAFGTHTDERSAVYALRETWRRRPALRPAVTGVLERLPTGVADEVRWQIEYLP